MYTTTFWKSTTERAIKTFAQSLIASIGVSATAPVWDLGWAEILGIALTATLLSVLTSVASAGIAEPGTPSAVDTHDTTGGAQALAAGAEAAELAGYPTANPHDPLPDGDGDTHHSINH